MKIEKTNFWGAISGGVSASAPRTNTTEMWMLEIRFPIMSSCLPPSQSWLMLRCDAVMLYGDRHGSTGSWRELVVFINDLATTMGDPYNKAPNDLWHINVRI